LRFLVCILSVLLLFSCSDKRFQGIAREDNYYPIQDTYPPQYRLYTEKDSATLFFKIPATGGIGNSGIKKTATKLQVVMYDDFTKRNLMDSLSIDVVASGDQVNIRQMVEGSVSLGTKDFWDKPVVMELFSKTKSTYPRRLVYIDSLYDDPSRFLVYDDDEKILFNNYVTSAEEVVVFSDFFKDKEVMAETYLQSDRLPKPPFSNFVPGPNRKKPIKSELLTGKDGKVSIVPSDSSYVKLSVADNPSINTTIYRFNKGYPNVSEVVHLVDALRYITTEEEYESIKSSKDPKVAIDEFWIACSGSKERARKLIKNYYGRVAYSNRYFTSFVPGWKTDRGLIYVIFGPPESVLITTTREYWVYGKEGSIDNVTFEFVKAKNPFSKTDYRLVRNEIYKPYWHRVVGAWREGRMYYK